MARRTLFGRQKDLLESVEGLNPGTGLGANRLGIRSPWGSGALSKVAWSDIFGSETQFISRQDAISIPAIAKARNLLVALLSGAPLVELNEDGLATEQSQFLQHTEGALSPWHRMAWTLDDLFFYGWSLWEVVRDKPNGEAYGKIIHANRVPVEHWSVDDEGQILIDTVPVDEANVILIPGPHEGLLTIAARTARGALRLEEAWIKKARNPIPVVELHETSETGMTLDEAQAYIQAYVDAREDENGAVAFTPFNIEIKPHGEYEAALYIEGRNFVRIDIAGFAGFPAAAMDGSLSTASLTYSTQEGKQNELATLSTPLWRGAFEGRMSQDDVVSSGNRVRYDLGDLFAIQPSPTGPITKD